MPTRRATIARVRCPRTAHCAAATALALALAVLPVRPAVADPAPSSGTRIAALLTELRALHRAAGAATEAYNATQERLRRHEARLRQLDRRLARARASLAAQRADAGRLARRQYRGEMAVLPPSVRLLLGEDPQDALFEVRLVDRMARQRARTLARLERARHRLEEVRRQARREAAAQRALLAERRERRAAVERRIDRAQRLLDSLTARQRERLRRLESAQVERAQRSLTARAGLSDAAPSAAGRRALRYALRQVGKPYGWGQAGPRAFDCSGLTSQAWAHAGRPIPRTSQAQWRELPRVPLSRLRPGDVVVYFPGATHVGLYAGDGKVVHAPRPGRTVEVAPMAVNPVLGAVRPDGRG